MKKSVLIVDDDPMICNEVEKELKRNFFCTFIAHTGSETLQVLKNEKIDIILLDIYIPDIDGLQMLEKVKKKWPNIEVIIMTGYSTHDFAIQAIRKGAIDYLEKPINFEELNTAIGRALERSSEKAILVHKHSILLADDDINITKTLKRVLEKEGYDVFIAKDGQEGLKTVNNNKIDIIIADIEMPVMSGIELLEKVKRFQKDIEVIMMTGFGDENLAVEALRKGAINYLRKPIDLDELLITIDQAIERILLYRNQLYRNRELKINSQIVSKINEELERRIDERTREISEMQSQLFQTSKLATLGEMAAGLAHELNQPLTGISLNAKNMKMLMQRELLTENEIKETIDNLEGLVKRMSKIIVHIRTFARQDLQKFMQMDVNESVKNALKLLKEQLRLHDIEFDSELNQDLPLISGEPYQIEQVIINVILNARDALEDRAKLEGSKKKLKVKTFLKNDWICIDVIDNGLGMPDEVKEKIFEPFYTTKEVGKATGLGMSISYGIIQNHRGRLDVRSKYGEGTTISIKLPIKMEDNYESENFANR